MKVVSLLLLLLPVAIDGVVRGQGVMLYSKADNSVSGIDVVTGTVAVTVPSNLFFGGAVGAARETAYDPVTNLLWYTATDLGIHSVNVSTLAAGPTIPNSEIPGAGLGDRHIYIDYARRQLLTPTSSGDTVFYDLTTQDQVWTLPATFFTDGNVGGYRHYASDAVRRTLWYAATDSTFREMNPDTQAHTGRVISTSEQVGAFPGAYRHMVVDPQRDLLLYAVTDGSIASIRLDTLQAATFTMGSNVFPGGNNGAGRIITYDLLPLPEQSFRASSGITGGMFGMSWTDLGGSYAYTIEYSDNPAAGAWQPVPPADQWPKSGVSSFQAQVSGPKRFFRLVTHLPGAVEPP